jgi:hypothetical protein
MVIILMSLIACGDKSGETGVEDSGDISISNVGPGGFSVVVNDCGPDDGTIHTIVINTEAKECGSQAPVDWSVGITLNNGLVTSGAVYQIGNEFSSAAMGIFSYEGQHSASEGEVWFEFEGDWSDGIEFTGYYWIDGEDMTLIEGSFEGVFCSADLQCG